MPPSPYPPADVDITENLVYALLAEQAPDLATEPLGERFEGWDNVTIRLGQGLAVRLPRLEASVALTTREIEWLPRIGARWTFPVPIPVRTGRPGAGFPWPWSVVPWFDGVDGLREPLSGDGALDLAAALREIHVRAPANAPTTPWRTTPLQARLDETLALVDRLENRLGSDVGWDGPRARTLLADAASRPWAATMWVHSDLHPKNIVTRGGRLAAILDWGEVAAGDPAQDVGQFWTLLDSFGVERALEAYGSLDADALSRARGEALVTALRLANTDDPDFVDAGWRTLANLGLADGPTPTFGEEKIP